MYFFFNQGQFSGLEETCWNKHTADNSMEMGQKRHQCKNAITLKHSDGPANEQ